MIKFMVPIKFSFKDYFYKWGFGDGDGIDAPIGYALREKAMGFINDELEKTKLPLQVTEDEGGGCHNNCRIGFEYVGRGEHNGERVWVYLDDEGDWGSLTIDQNPDIKVVKLKEVLANAEKKFEEEAKKLDVRSILDD